MSLSACASAAVALCVHVCLCCLPAGRTAMAQGASARVALRCVDYFLPYIAMTGHVVSPVVAGGQQCSSLLAPLSLLPL